MKINKYIIFILQLVFLLVFFGFVLLQKSQKPRILFMHSYLNDYAWVSEINTGIERALGGRQDVVVRFHYMDLKNHNAENFRRTAAAISNRTIEKWQPDVLVLIDDWAQQLIGTKYTNHPTMKIVFAGVNAAAEDYGYDKADNVTGILERMPLNATRETLMMIAKARGFSEQDQSKGKPRLVYVADKSLSVDGMIPPLSEYDWSPLEWVAPIRVGTFDEWKKVFQNIDKNADLVLISDYEQLLKEPGGKEFVKSTEVMQWTEANSSVPILGMGTVNVLHGGMMMVGGSGYEQGEVAAERAVELALGKSIEEFPITRTKMFIVAVRKSAMDKRNLPIPTIYEAFARATNNFYE